jgi:hypothetical protein
MLRIRDLGINAIPEKRVRAKDGLFAANGCGLCTVVTDIPCGDCTNPSGDCIPTNEPCEPCTHPTDKRDAPCSSPSGLPRKARALTHEAIAQLQYQMQQRASGNVNLSV